MFFRYLNNATKAAVSFLLACCFFAAAVMLRIEPSAKIWPDYQIVYFPENQDLSFLSESSVQDLFPGILSRQTAKRSDILTPPDFSVSGKVYHGMYLSVLSVIDPIFRDGYTSDSIRSFFFTDKDGQYELVYVPDAYFRSFRSLLDSRKLTYGSDSTVKAPYRGGLVTVILALVLIIIVRPAPLHILMLIPLVASSFLAPWYSVNCIACAALGLFPFVNRYWNRCKGIQLFFRNPVCIVFMLLITVLCFLTPGRIVLVAMLCLCSAVFAGLAVRLQEQWAARIRHFSFTPILSGLFVQVEQKQKTGVLILYSVAVLVLLFLSLFTMASGNLSDRQDLSLPGPKLYTDYIGTVDGWESFIDTASDADGLRYPDITDFAAELWQKQSAGYRKFNQSGELIPRSGSKVSVSHFVEDENGVHQVQNDILVFDDYWLGTTFDWLAENDSVAAFLLRENKTPATTYTAAGKFTVTSTDYAGIFLSVVVASALCFILLIKRTLKKTMIEKRHQEEL